MPLTILIAGAGIAGLSTAVALRQAGHTVKVYEKSPFSHEIGAALVLSSNGSRVLQHLGFSFEKAHGMPVRQWDTLDGTTFESLVSLDLSGAERKFGGPIFTVGRVDLHAELLRLAKEEDEGEGDGNEDGKARDGEAKERGRRRGPKVELFLSSKVISADPENGTLELADGTIRKGDLIVAADGLHSVLKPIVLGRENVVAGKTGMSAFRFLIPTGVLKGDQELAEMLEWKCKGVTILADTRETEKERERHMVWYDCQGGEVQNFVGIHPSHPDDEEKVEDYQPSMLREFSHFHPNILKIIKYSSHPPLGELKADPRSRQARNVSRWPLNVHDPISTWSRGKIVLIGDAAHPMLPFGGQGSNQAIEDAGALGYLFQDVDSPDAIPERLRMFEQVRRKRAARVQILSKVRSGKEPDVREELERYADPIGSAVPSNFAERNAHDYGFDVYAKCAEVLHRSQIQNQNQSQDDILAPAPSTCEKGATVGVQIQEITIEQI